MRKKFFFNYITLIIIGVTVTGFLSAQLMQNFYKKEMENRLVDTALLMDYQLSRELKLSGNLDYSRIVSDYFQVLNTLPRSSTSTFTSGIRITFIDVNGNVLGESSKSLNEMENHLMRKEVQEALRGEIGKDIRFSSSMKVDFMYIAIPLKATQSEVIIRAALPLDYLKKIYEIIWRYGVLGIIAGIFPTVLLALKLSYHMTKPINEFSSVSKEIARGNYEKRVHIKSRDELGQLAETFNEMTSKLRETVAYLEDKNLKLDSVMNSLTNGIIVVNRDYKIVLINKIACEILDITNDSSMIGSSFFETIRINKIYSLIEETIEKNHHLSSEISLGTLKEKILRINTNLIKPADEDENDSRYSEVVISIQDVTNIRKLEQIRSDFVSNVTHELKTPLTSIRGFIETLRNGAINDNEVAKRFLEIIDIEAERLYMLINDILELSEIESRQGDSNIKIHSLEPLIGEVVSFLQGVADKKNVRIDYQADPDVSIEANRDRIKQMLINLIDNAIKYNKNNGSVSVKAVKAQGRIIISIKDTGIGIGPEFVPRIFERFYRVDKGRSRNMGGTGLGLSIVKHIVNLYNGDIKVISEPGKGSEFIVQFPSDSYMESV